MTEESQRPSGSASTRLGSLRGRLLRALGVLAVTLVAVCCLATIALDRLGGAIGLILKENYVSVVACQEMNEALERQDSAALFAATGHGDLGDPVLRERRTAFETALAIEAGNITLPGEGDLVRDVDGLYRDYTASVDRVLGGPADRRIEGYFAELLPRFHALKDKVTRIRLLNQRNMEWADSEARRVARRTLEIAIGVTLAALLLVTWLVRRLPGTILRPLATFTEVARAIGDGRLDTEIPRPDLTELRALADALGRMQTKLLSYRESSLGELLAAKDLSRATVASMVDPVLVFGPQGDLLLTNDAAESTFLVAPTRAGDLHHTGGDIPDAIALARDTALLHREGPAVSSLADAMRWVTREGERYFLIRATPLRTDETGARGAIVIAQDVTRFRRIDALKSDVVATVSHELKTPLTSLRLATHMLADESAGPLTETQRELAQTARDETERLQSTVNELLDLVRIEREAGAPRLVSIAPRALLGEVAAGLRALAERAGVQLVVDAAGSADVQVDPEQMSIVVANLVSNAVRHSAEGSTVTLGADDAEDAVVLSVTDQGEGIPAEHLGRIFERHWSGGEPATLKGRHGLGLAIAKEIVGRHGGSIEVESERARGTTFRIRLPRASNADGAEATTQP